MGLVSLQKEARQKEHLYHLSNSKKAAICKPGRMPSRHFDLDSLQNCENNLIPI
jgi:hypothetical protein